MKKLIPVVMLAVVNPALAFEPTPPPRKKPPIYVQEMWQQQQQKQQQKQQITVNSGYNRKPAAYAPSLSLTAHNCIGAVNGVVGAGGVISGGVGWTRVHHEACAMEWALKCLAFQALRGRTWVNRCVDRALFEAEWSKPLSDPRLRRAMKRFDDAGKVHD